MVTPAIFIALLGTINLKPAISAAISSEPIQITVNENFNTPSGQVSREFQSFEPGVVHQGANFYFKPKFTLPSTSVPHHIEALMSLIQQHHSCSQDATKEIFENKLMEILKPFMYAKETVTDIVLEEENNSKTAKPSSILITEETKPPMSELLVIPEAPALPPPSFNSISSLVEEELKKEELESKSVPDKPIVIEIEPKPSAPKLLVIPEAPVLPPFSADEVRVVEEVQREELKTVPESIVVDTETKPATPELLVIPEAPVLPPLSFNDISAFVIEEVTKEESVILEETKGVSEEPIVIEIEPKPVSAEHLVIPEAPVLPTVPVNGIRIVEEVKIEEPKTVPESIVVEIESKPATPELFVIPKAPVLPPLSFNDISAFVEEEVKKEESKLLEETKGVSEEPLITVVTLTPAAPEFQVIPEAPVLPPLSYNDVSAFVEEGIKKEESVILQKAKGVSEQPIVIEVEPKPVTPERVFIPDAPVLPPFSADEMRIVEEVQREELKTVPESIVVDIESKPATPEFLVIPEAPVLPPLSFNDISAFVVEEVKKEESVILEETKVVSEEPIVIEIEPKPSAPELLLIPEAPVLPPFSADEMRIVEEVQREELKTAPDSIVVDIESKPATPELFMIPEAPVLPPLSYKDVSAFVEEGIKKEESVILENPKSVPEEPIVIEIEPKPVASELVFIPEAPVLPPFSADELRIVEKVQREDLKTAPESIVVDIESKPATPELLVIPEAPVLTPLSFNDISAFVIEEVKKEESEILDETKVVSEEPIVIEIEPKPSAPELLVIPDAPVLPPFSADEMRIVEEVQREELKTAPESIVVDIESKPATPELFVIPEAPVLPPLSYKDVSAFVEEGIKKEESVILKNPKSVPEEPIAIEIEPKPVASELVFIPEAPVLPPFSADELRIVEEVQREDLKTAPESIVVDIESKPATPELLVIPEAPVLTPLSFNDISAFVIEEVKKEESEILEETKVVSEEPIVIKIEPKPSAPELLVIPKAPVLPPFSADEMRIVEEVQREELKTAPESIVVDIESKPTTPELYVIPEAPVLPPLSYKDVSAFVEEGIKKEESVILENPKSAPEEPIVIEIEPKPVTSELVIIPEAPVLPPFSADELRIVEEVQREELKTVPESIVVDIESKPATPELLVIPEAPVLPTLSYNNVSAFVEEGIKKEESEILEKAKGVSEDPIVIEVEPKPTTPELVFIPEAPVLSPLSENRKPLTPLHLVNPKLPMLPPLTFKNIRNFVEDEMKKKESVILEEILDTLQEKSTNEIVHETTTPEHVNIPEAPVLPSISKHDIRFVEETKIDKSMTLPMAESIVADIEPKPATPELLAIPEAPVLPPLSFNDISAFVEEEIKKKDESIKLEESISVPHKPSVIEIETKPATPELLVIPEAPMLAPLSYNDVSVFVEEGIKKEESVILEKAQGVSEEPIVLEVEPKPAIQELVIIPEPPVLPSMSDITAIKEVKSEETIISEEFTGRIPEKSVQPTLESFVETETAESYPLEENIFPVAAEELKIEIPILLEESIEVFHPTAESSRPSLHEYKMSNSYVFEKDPQPNSEHLAKKTFPPTIIRPSKPSNNLGLFSYAPFLSHLSNHAPKTKQVMFPKPASLERFLLKKHPLRLPVAPFPKLPLKDIKSPFLENSNQFLYPTAYAHDVVEKRIAPNMAFKSNAPPKRVKIFIRSNVSKGSS